MTHEFKEIIESYVVAKQQGIPAVMATVVDVEGSSYRRPGVGMLLLQNGVTKGAVSGGCVEKEVFRQAQSVFETGVPKMMTYDGKYRLGCEGLLYILIETFDIHEKVIVTIREKLKSRKSFEITSFYSKHKTNSDHLGSVVQFDDGKKFPFSNHLNLISFQQQKQESFQRKMQPCFRLIIIGTEHDAVKLCQLAAMTGWEIEVVGSPKNPKQLEEFPGANKVLNYDPGDVKIKQVDKQTAVVLMTHNFAKDLLYLQAIKGEKPIYIGLLGPARRREKLLSAFIDYHPEVADEFLDSIHGPAGLNLGAETPEEIAISIIAEILSVIRNQEPIPLQNKKGAIHDDPKRKSINVISSKP
ncbi:XdhC family protein [Aquimarina gracilis]|uniref:XdhC family protein n=1 Tax=Aquimarina gracilis TaxID=874422 RepID=A0ABU6A297_9FLAO|nr:XdhC family protein [Aquimarina gracilis]MEB3348266.1 XdhC family protein [Aquimarina gracilis]